MVFDLGAGSAAAGRAGASSATGVLAMGVVATMGVGCCGASTGDGAFTASGVMAVFSATTGAGSVLIEAGGVVAGANSSSVGSSTGFFLGFRKLPTGSGRGGSSRTGSG